MIKLTRGTDLLPETRRQVLRAFTYRLTFENGYPRRNPCKARVEPITDAEWLAAHAFYTRKDGALDGRMHYCEPAFLADNDVEEGNS